MLDGDWHQAVTSVSFELQYAKGRFECEIITQLDALKGAYRRIKQRAPTSSDLFPDGAFYRRNVSRMVKTSSPTLAAKSNGQPNAGS